MRMSWVGLACVAVMTIAAGPAAPPSPVQPAPSTMSKAAKLKFRSVTLHVFHRAFENFHDQVEAKIGQEFRIGDSNYTGIVTDFVPDFMMDLKSRKVTTRSNEPNNPAVRVVVRRGGKAQDTTWAFLNMPPHFAKKSLVACLAPHVSFEHPEPVASRDSLAVRMMQLEGR